MCAKKSIAWEYLQGKVTTAKQSLYESPTHPAPEDHPPEDKLFFLIKGRQGKKNQESKQGLNAKRPKKFN